MSSFVSFAQDAATDSHLAREFVQTLSAGSVEALRAWFGERGYSVDEVECRRLLDKKSADGEPRGGTDFVPANY